jgi:replication factor C small subunit
MAKIRQLWVETHRPKTMNDVVFQNTQQKKKFLSYVADREFPHILLVGVQGSGKTTISEALVSDIVIDEIDVLVINASKENSVDIMRDKITSFCQTYASSKFKVVRLEEMDGLSPAAQRALRVIMEQYSDYCRFIGTANYENLIIPALRSRFQTYHFKTPAYEEVAVLVAEMLIAENVDFDPTLLEKYIAASYPDIRKLINTLDQHSVNGVLEAPMSTDSGDYKFKIIDLLEAGNLREIRKLICESASAGDYEEIYKFMFENIHKCKGFDQHKSESAIVLIADHLFKHSMIADAEINFAAMCIRINAL